MAITKDGQSGKIVLAFALMLAYTIISVAIRLHTRWPWRRLFRREDTVLLLATAVSIGYTVTLALAVHNGLGTRVTAKTSVQVHQGMVEDMVSISFVLFFLTEGLGTVSYGLFLVSLAEDDSGHRLALKACCYLEAVFTTVAVIVTSVYASRRESLSVRYMGNKWPFQADLSSFRSGLPSGSSKPLYCCCCSVLSRVCS